MRLRLRHDGASRPGDVLHLRKRAVCVVTATPGPVLPSPDADGDGDLAEQVARALYRAAGLNGNDLHDPWEERSQKVHLRYLALAEDGVLPLLAEREASLRAEVERLKRALAGHLFDGESLSTREAIRNELIDQALELWRGEP